MLFVSPTKGSMDFDEMFREILAYVESSPDSQYKLIVGSDSHNREEALFVSAVIIHRVGKGARYFYARIKEPKMTSLRQRIFYETSLSLGLASRLAERLASNGASNLNVEIHCDIGQKGDTRDLVREIVGMVMGSGFDAKIKPESYGATKVADKHTK